MLAGRAALEGEDFIQLGMATADPGRRPTPRTLGAQVSDEVEAVCARALSVNPTERFPTAGEFWNALREAAGHAPMTHDDRDGTSAVRSASARSRAPRSAAALGWRPHRRAHATRGDPRAAPR